MIAFFVAALVAAPQTSSTAPVKAQAPTAAVLLNRVFKKGEKQSYSVHSTLQSQNRSLGLQTFIPSDLDLLYNFSIEVKEMKADGIAVMQYLRPQFTEIDGETFNSPPRTHVEKTNDNVLLTVSPINEILMVVDQSKKPVKKGSGEWMSPGISSPQDLGQLIGPYIGEIHRLALFFGPLDSSLDFSPKLPFDEVAVGETWKKTVSYQPQKVKGSDKQAVQRLDYTFTYKGIDTYNSKKYYKVNGALALNTDLAEFFNQSFGLQKDESILKSIPLKLNASVDFYLDMQTKTTVYAEGHTDGGYQITISQSPNEPVQEETFKGTSIMKLVSTTMVPPVKK